ncbi:MAG: tRNA 2-thiouridine(34) synthase MnmA [Patescibacteria group bacterium]
MKKYINKQKKVFVGMSGGVDSSVASALLKKQGYDVTGVFIKVWQPDFVECQWKEDRLDAMRVCALLDIPFLDLDLEKEYKKDVFNYMIDEYKKGRTPNPDVMCNKKIKFGAFLDFALKNGANYIATGHYVRLNHLALGALSKSLGTPSAKWELLAGVDKNKDQSYFLWTLTQEQLKYCLFPVGEYEKPQIRKMAEKFGLPVAQKKDSQGLCFVGKVDMKEFLERFIPQKKGNVADRDGKIIGKHDGVHYYTLGQRHGFEITQKGTDDKPYYIIAKDLKKNILIVSNTNTTIPDYSVQTSREVKPFRIEIDEVNWIAGQASGWDKKYSARIRYRQPLQNCKLKKENNKIFVEFDKSQNTDSGQSVVIYDGEICLGGGVVAG